jgi:hypothetical protein
MPGWPAAVTYLHVDRHSKRSAMDRNAWREKMTGFKTIAAALVLSAASATAAFAQAAISEPGAYAFYHPNGDVLNSGWPRPATDAMAAVRLDAGPDRLAPHRVTHHRSHRAD